MLRYLLFVGFLFSFCNITLAQGDLEIYGWKSYLPYQNGIYVTQSESKIYYATDQAILVLDKQEKNPSFFSKVDGLSEVGISIIKYSPFEDVLLVCYQNSVIDLVKEDRIISFNDIAENTNISGDKRINDVLFQGDRWAYLATSFGVIQFDTRNEEFGFTARMNIKVNALEIFDGKIFAATEEGIYFASIWDNLNLGDFNQWTFLGPSFGLPAIYESTSLAEYNNRLYFDQDGSLYAFDRTSSRLVLEKETERKVLFLTAEGDDLLVGWGCEDESCGGNVYFFDRSELQRSSGSLCSNRPRYAIEDQFGQVWYADSWRNFRVAPDRARTCEALNFNTPRFQSLSEISVKDDKVYVAGGGVTPGWNYLFNRNGFYTYIDGQWTNYNRSDFSFLAENNLLDFLRILPHPENDNFYVGTYWGGLIEVTPDSMILYDDTWSSLQGAVGDGARERIGGLAFDDQNNLWMSNYLAPRPISVFKNTGEWESFEIGSANSTLGPALVDDFGNKWFVIVGSNQGVLVFNEGDSGNPQIRVFTESNSELPTNSTYCLAKDQDGAVWVGTAEGPVIFECGDPFDNDCIGFRKKIDQEGIIAFLLSEEEILSIEVDGANRKWFGTRNGVFVQSPDGETQIHAFDTDNSPLFNNTIIDIAIVQTTGEVFIGSEGGIQSFRTDAIEGKSVNSASAYAYPNPVRPEYDGPIAIRGLARDANVKITDMMGQLVFETQALGGQAIWNGRDFTGRKASTGVYLVYSTSEANFSQPDAIVTKILFIK